MIYENVEKFLARVDKQIQRDGSANMRPNLLALTTAIVDDYCLKSSMRLLDEDNEEKALDWHDTISSLTNMAPIARQWSWITPFAMSLPYSLIRICSPEVARIVAMHLVSTLYAVFLVVSRIH